MKIVLRTCLCLALVAPIAACSSSGQQKAAGVSRKDSELITQEQIKAGQFHNAYDAVQALRINWMTSRPRLAPETRNRGVPLDTTEAGRKLGTRAEEDRSAPGENGGVVVYLDGARLGGVEQLKLINTQTVYAIRHYRDTDATTRFGTGHSFGVIQVLTRPD